MSVSYMCVCEGACIHLFTALCCLNKFFGGDIVRLSVLMKWVPCELSIRTWKSDCFGLAKMVNSWLFKYHWKDLQTVYTTDRFCFKVAVCYNCT